MYSLVLSSVRITSSWYSCLGNGVGGGISNRLSDSGVILIKRDRIPMSKRRLFIALCLQVLQVLKYSCLLLSSKYLTNSVVRHL